MTETNSQDKPVETAPATPQVPDDREKLVADAADARRRASIAEQQAAYAAGALAASQRNSAPNTPVVDPLVKYSNEDLTMSPDEKRHALDQAIRMRASQASAENDKRLEQRLAYERQSMESKFAMDMIMSQKPELQDPKNAPNFAAAVTKVKMEADALGQTISPAQLAMRAGQVYDQIFKNRNTQTPPFVEGQSRPDLAPTAAQAQAAQQPTVASYLEKTYGQKKDTVRPMYDINDSEQVDAMNMEYVRGKNEPLFKRGAVSMLNAVNATRSE